MINGGTGTGTVTNVSFTGGLIAVANPSTVPALTVAGTSGGLPYFSSASTWASSAALTLNGIVLGGGAGAPPTVTAADSTITHALFATAGAPAFRALLSTDIPALAYVTSVGWTGGIVTVATGTTTPAFTIAGTSGGIPYFSSASTWATSGALTVNGVVLGGGAGATPTVTAADSTTTHALFATAGAPAFRAVVSGDIPALAYVTSATIAGTAGQITATGTCTITTTGTCTLSLPASISGVTNLTPGADFTITQNSVVPFTSILAGALVNTLVLKAGRVGSGTASPTAKLDVEDTNVANIGIITAVDTTAFAQGVGALISLRGKFNTAGTSASFGAIQGLKENATDENFLGALAFSTLQAGGNLVEAMRINSSGSVAIGMTAPVYGLDVSRGVGLTGTARFFDQTATTGATLVTITPGASQTAASKVFEIAGNQKFGGTNSTAAVAGLIGTTCPAVTCTAAYTWVQAIAADNSVVYFPVWK
jgi:hypothetical protein